MNAVTGTLGGAALGGAALVQILETVLSSGDVVEVPITPPVPWALAGISIFDFCFPFFVFQFLFAVFDFPFRSPAWPSLGHWLGFRFSIFDFPLFIPE